MVLNLKRADIDWIKGILYNQDGETLGEAAQRSCGCPVIGNVQGQVGQSLEEIGPVEGVPIYNRGVGTK